MVRNTIGFVSLLDVLGWTVMAEARDASSLGADVNYPGPSNFSSSSSSNGGPGCGGCVGCLCTLLLIVWIGDAAYKGIRSFFAEEPAPPVAMATDAGTPPSSPSGASVTPVRDAPPANEAPEASEPAKGEQHDQVDEQLNQAEEQRDQELDSTSIADLAGDSSSAPAIPPATRLTENAAADTDDALNTDEMPHSEQQPQEVELGTSGTSEPPTDAPAASRDPQLRPVETDIGGPPDSPNRDAATTRVWMGSNGKRLEAAFLGYRAGKIGLRTREGEEYWFPINRVSQADRLYVLQQLAVAQNASDAKPVLQMREWTTVDGKFRVAAAFLAAHGGQAYLLKDSGRIIKVKLDQLSGSDQLYVDQMSSPAAE